MSGWDFGNVMSILCQVLLEGLNGEPSAGNSNIEAYINASTVLH